MTLLSFRMVLGMAPVKTYYLADANSDECVPYGSDESQEVRHSKRLRMEITHQFSMASRYGKTFTTDFGL